MIQETEMLAPFVDGYDFPPLRMRLTKTVSGSVDTGVDALFEATAAGKTYEFEVELKGRNSPKAFQELLYQLERIRDQRKGLPLLLVPYLRETQLDELQQRQLSGLDLCGNGVVTVPGKLLVYRTGKPNRFPDSAPTRYAYRGATSLVARVFLCRARFGSLADINQEIEARGGRVVLSTISKALKRMESDLIVDRTPENTRLRQPEKLLEKLVESYIPPRITRSVTLTSKKPLAELVGRVAPQASLTFSGRSSIAQYTVMGRTDSPVLFTRNVAQALRQWGNQVQETTRFIDFELRETADPTVYFDARMRENLPHASPIQVYLECMTGDKRERETTLEVRELILRELRESGAAESDA